MFENPIYTIGYGARDIEEFLRVLRAKHIQYLIDVRSQPYSSYKPAFSKIELQTFLESKGIRYVFMGDNLGGRPDDPVCYTDGKVDYEKIARQPFYRQGIERLHKASRQNLRVALMCSEGKPENCHRTQLIGQTLIDEGIDVQHIDENDEAIPQDQVLLRLTKGQQSLALPESPPKPALNLSVERQKETFSEQISQVARVLQQTFGYPHFRPLQEEVITNVLQKRDSLAVMPTGSGKSLCYQIPATLLPGLTVVVSPLISLMEDQVLELREWGVPAAYLNSSLSHTEYLETTAQIRAGEIKLLYAAPETLLRPETMQLMESCRIDSLVIDEAHCISEWGHDFRPEYRQLAGLRARLPEAVTLAVTATATRRVRQDIKISLGITDANEFVSSFNRENLFLAVADKINGVAQVQGFLDEHAGQAGIIYCATRKQVDSLTAQLEAAGYPVLPYHAGMDTATRRAHQRRFRYEDGIIMVATIAFGMGINKPNVRFILHYDLPKNIENYYQQIGRAGRDGLRADCLVLFSYGDVGTIRYFIEQGPPDLRRGAEARLQALLNFVDARACRRVPLLTYFGEEFPKTGCGTCDNCLAASPKGAQSPEKEMQTGTEAGSENVELTVPAQQLIICAQETGEIFGVAHLIAVLRGSQSKKVLKFNHEKVSSYGVGRDYTKEQWRHLSNQFIRRGLLERTRPHGGLKVTDEGRAILQSGEVWGSLPGMIFGKSTSHETRDHDANLFEQLRALRSDLASERNLPPYVIFHDRALMEMATFFPHTPAELGQIYGVGQRKTEEYGPHFLPIIRAYCQENDLQPVQKRVSTIAKRASPAGQQRTQTIWEQFQSGQSISAIAAELGFVENTILNHLKKSFDAGRPLRVEGLKNASELSEPDEQRVMAAFNEHGTDYLKPIFSALGGEVSYDQLHLWRLIYQITMG